jgi:hypothetical protein
LLDAGVLPLTAACCAVSAFPVSCLQVVIKNAIAVPGIVGDIETTPQFPVTNYKITTGINPNAMLGVNGTKGNRTMRIRNPRTNRTALAVSPEAAAAPKQTVTAVSEKAGHFVGVGLALPQVPQKEFAVRRYSQQVRDAPECQAALTVAAAVGCGTRLTDYFVL